jgi:hypothetical protein
MIPSGAMMHIQCKAKLPVGEQDAHPLPCSRTSILAGSHADLGREIRNTACDALYSPHDQLFPECSLRSANIPIVHRIPPQTEPSPFQR